MPTSQITSRALALRAVITDYLASRLEDAIKAKKLVQGTLEYQSLVENHTMDAWLATMASNARGAQILTHFYRYTFPKAHIKETTNLYCPPDTLPVSSAVNTASLGKDFTQDLVGATAMPLYSLLKQPFEDTTLLQLCLSGDTDMQAALHDDHDTGLALLTVFASLMSPKVTKPTTHTLAKQVYWLTGSDPTDDSAFVLLSPLHSAPLSQKIYETIQADLYGEAAVEARAAARAGKYNAGVARTHPNLAVQQVGGSNPRNISALFNQRRGVNYLLPSLPPQRTAKNDFKPLNVASIFQLFTRRRDTKLWVNELQAFLTGYLPSNLKTRNEIDRLVNGLLDELYVYTAQFQALPAGWSADSELSEAQCCWLDPSRALIDEDFADEWLSGDWSEQVERDFARWLNSELGEKVAALGDVEFRRWAREMRTHSVWAKQIDANKKLLLKHVAKE